MSEASETVRHPAGHDPATRPTSEEIAMTLDYLDKADETEPSKAATSAATAPTPVMS